MVEVNLKGCGSFVKAEDYKRYVEMGKEALRKVEEGTCPGSDFLGWNHLPSRTSDSELDACLDVVNSWIEKEISLVVVIGIGGSYLGAKAAIEALSHSFSSHLPQLGPRVVFAGNNLSEDYISELMDLVRIKNTACVVISKSGTTTEPAVAFRIVKNYLEQKYGRQEACSRIVAITDKKRGALKSLSNQEGYRTFVIEDNVGGRFSVLSPVGILPIALAGFDIRALMQGARDMEAICSSEDESNPSLQYAAMRNLLYSRGKRIELLVGFNPKLQYLGEWWKQLYGESEGKQGRGLFPASVNFTTDLHSMGQYIQDGERILFESVVTVGKASRRMDIPYDEQNLDGLNFLAGKCVEHCNRMAQKGTAIAHIDGGVPNMEVKIEILDEYNLGSLFYFFEKACAISAGILGINGFDQPGVEAYKKNMFALLEKPGYERQGALLRERLGE